MIQLAKISKVLKHNFLSDVEQRYGLQPESASITFRIESLTPEVANQLASLMEGLLHSVP